MGPQENMFGIEQLETFLLEHSSDDVEMVLSLLMDHVSHQHAQGRSSEDDITIIAFEFLGVADKKMNS